MSDPGLVSVGSNRADGDDKENREGNPIEQKYLEKIRDATLKVQTKKLLRQIPRDVLSLEWLQSIASSSSSPSSSSPQMGTVVFLLDEVVPCLTLALERLLFEISRRGLDDRPDLKPDADDSRIRFENGENRVAKNDPEVTAFKGVFDVNFNPINFVAQFLMRHNPKFATVQRGNAAEGGDVDGKGKEEAPYATASSSSSPSISSLSSGSSYVRSLREISEEVKNKMAEEKMAPQKGRRREEENPSITTRRVTMWM